MDEEIFSLNQEQFIQCFLNGWIVDGRDGGLIIGRRHQEGHITMIQATNAGEFQHIGFVEGGEYIMSPAATKAHFARLEEINSDKSPCAEEICVSVDSQIINTRAEPHDKFLVIQQQFIININATKRHFRELEELNKNHRYYHGRIFSDEIIKAITEPGFVRY